MGAGLLTPSFCLGHWMEGAGSSCLNFEVLAWRQLVDIWVARAQERGFHWKYRLGDQHLRDENQSHSKGNL